MTHEITIKLNERLKRHVSNRFSDFTRVAGNKKKKKVKHLNVQVRRYSFARIKARFGVLGTFSPKRRRDYASIDSAEMNFIAFTIAIVTLETLRPLNVSSRSFLKRSYRRNVNEKLLLPCILPHFERVTLPI